MDLILVSAMKLAPNATYFQLIAFHFEIGAQRGLEFVFFIDCEVPKSKIYKMGVQCVRLSSHNYHNRASFPGGAQRKRIAGKL